MGDACGLGKIGMILAGMMFGALDASVGVSVSWPDAPPGLLAAPGRKGGVELAGGALPGIGAPTMAPIRTRTSTAAAAIAATGTRCDNGPNSVLSVVGRPDLAARAEPT